MSIFGVGVFYRTIHEYLAEFSWPSCRNHPCTKKVSFSLNSSNGALIVFPPCVN